MPRPKDVHLNSSGDLEIGSNGDIKCVYDDDVTVDGVLFRLQTYAGDYDLEPTCGASLEDFIGMPNTAQTAQAVTQRVTAALTKDGFVSSKNLSVDTLPLSTTELAVVVRVEGGRSTFAVAASLDLLTGKIKISS